MKNKKCFNCIHAGKQFKLSGKTHLHCNHPKYKEAADDGTLSVYDTLMDFSDTCISHEFKESKNKPYKTKTK